MLTRFETPIAPTWSRPPAKLILGGNEIHIWRASLDYKTTVIDSWETQLAATERARAAGFVYWRDRRRFVARRTILRKILSRYLDCPSTDVRFIYHAQGKPALHPDGNAIPIRFNLSQSRDLAVYAFSWREVGIDVEAIRRDIKAEDIATRLFSSSEVAQFRSTAPDQKTERFFLCWTRKESYVKGLGAGLSLPLNSFTVSLTAQLLHETATINGAVWKLCSFLAKQTHIASVMGRGEKWSLRFWDLTKETSFLSWP
jgi:4'-phosphopantetheinyl transferase